MGNQLTIQNKQTSLATFTPQLNRILESVSKESAEIVKARYEGAMFRDMGERNRLTAAALIIADLALLTGIKFPTGDAFDRLKQYTAESLFKDYEYYSVPLVQKAMKQHASVLTSGEKKSYGRTLSLADFHQVMDCFCDQVRRANDEVQDALNKDATAKIVDAHHKENIIRSNIQRTYQQGDFDLCSYADFNQLVRDGLMPETYVKKVAWGAVQALKEKYKALSEKIATSDPNDPESVKGITEKRNVQEKLQLISQLEDEIKGEAVKAFMRWEKANNRTALYEEIKK